MSRAKIVWTEQIIIRNSIEIPAIYIIIQEKFPNIRVYGHSMVVNECVHNDIKMLLRSGIYFLAKFSLDSRRNSRSLTYIRTMTLAYESSREKSRCMLKTTETTELQNGRSHFWPVFVTFPLCFCIDASFFYKKVLSLVHSKTYRRPYARVFILKLPVAIIIRSTRLERRYFRRTISQTDRQAKVVSIKESNQNRSANSINNRDKPWKE